MLHRAKFASTVVIIGALCGGFSVSAFAQASVTSSIIVQNTTYGPNAASINTNGSPGGCKGTIGTGTATCQYLNNITIPVNTQVSGDVVYQASNAYNTLYEADLTYYLSTVDPGINRQSSTECTFQIQIVKQLSQYGQPWQGSISFKGEQDTNTPLVPNVATKISLLIGIPVSTL